MAFYEYKCGCIESPQVGKVRYCNPHVRRAGGVAVNSGTNREYPSHGEAVPNWNGGK